MENERVAIADSPASTDHWKSEHSQCRTECDSDSNTFEDDQPVPKIKPEVELKEESDGFVYKTDTHGNLKLVCSNVNISCSNADICETSLNEISSSSHFGESSGHLKHEYLSDKMIVTQDEHIKDHIDTEIPIDTTVDVARYSDSFPSYSPHSIITYASEDEPFDVPSNAYPGSSQQKLYSMDDLQFHSRIYTSLDPHCENKVTYHLNVAINSGKQITPVRDGENTWMYNLQTMRISEDVINVPDLQYIKDAYEPLDVCNKQDTNDSESDLWRLYQELLTQKKLEVNFSLSEEQKREKMREIGRIRARLYRAKLRQNAEAWKKHKAIRAQKQREERLKLSEEQREKIKALARIRAKKHREKLRENAETWKQYKEMRAEKQRLDRLRAKEQVKEEAQKLEVVCSSDNSERLKELARERAKKHRQRLKENTDTWSVYKESRAQKKREERLAMPSDQRERLKERARIRAKKYREKMKEDIEEWKKYKEMRARKQREERLKLSEEQRQRAKALARERAKLYREKKRLQQQMMIKESSDTSSVPQDWCDTTHNLSLEWTRLKGLPESLNIFFKKHFDDITEEKATFNSSDLSQPSSFSPFSGIPSGICSKTEQTASSTSDLDDNIYKECEQEPVSEFSAFQGETSRRKGDFRKKGSISKTSELSEAEKKRLYRKKIKDTNPELWKIIKQRDAAQKRQKRAHRQMIAREMQMQLDMKSSHSENVQSLYGDALKERYPDLWDQLLHTVPEVRNRIDHKSRGAKSVTAYKDIIEAEKKRIYREKMKREKPEMWERQKARDAQRRSSQRLMKNPKRVYKADVIKTEKLDNNFSLNQQNLTYLQNLEVNQEHINSGQNTCSNLIPLQSVSLAETDYDDACMDSFTTSNLALSDSREISLCNDAKYSNVSIKMEDNPSSTQSKILWFWNDTPDVSSIRKSISDTQGTISSHEIKHPLENVVKNAQNDQFHTKGSSEKKGKDKCEKD